LRNVVARIYIMFMNILYIRRASLLLTLCILLHVSDLALAADEAGQKGVVLKEFIYEEAPFPECHASTIAETKAGLVAAWFGGTEESNADVGIWLAHRDDEKWSAPVEVATGVYEGQRYPCWNPVLFNLADDRLLLFYKVGPSPSSWWGMKIESADQGSSWSAPQRLPNEILGPIKNKPVLLSDGRLLCGSSSEHEGWRVHMEWMSDGGDIWERTEALNKVNENEGIQPTVLKHGGDRLQILCRSRRSGKILTSTSEDGGRTWSALANTALPNPNSGIDAVTLSDGRHVVVYNHTSRGRSPLNVAVSEDGTVWRAAIVLEDQPGEYSYPAVIQTSDGMVHITYTWKRQRVRHVVVDPAKLELGETYR